MFNVNLSGHKNRELSSVFGLSNESNMFTGQRLSTADISNFNLMRVCRLQNARTFGKIYIYSS